MTTITGPCAIACACGILAIGYKSALLISSIGKFCLSIAVWGIRFTWKRSSSQAPTPWGRSLSPLQKSYGGDVSKSPHGMLCQFFETLKWVNFLPRNALQCKARSCDCMSSVCLSVRLSVTLVICDHIGWKSWKLVARTISPTPSLFVAKRRSTYSQENICKFWRE